MAIQFKQYIRPDGFTKSVSIDRPAEIEEKAAMLVASGYVFEAEVLTTGEVSLTIEYDFDDESPFVTMEVVPNGPGVPDAVDRLVLSAMKQLLPA